MISFQATNKTLRAVNPDRTGLAKVGGFDRWRGRGASATQNRLRRNDMLLIDGGRGPVAVRPRIWDYFTKWWHIDQLTIELAHGASPDSSVAMALRARTLTNVRSRRKLTDGLERAIDLATGVTAISSGAACVNSAEIVLAMSDIVELRRLLLADGPASVHGIARAHVLLTSGAGPLYNRRSAAGLAPAVRQAIEGMIGPAPGQEATPNDPPTASS